MKKRAIGRSGLMAGVVSMGTWAIGGGERWGDSDERASIATVHRAFELGVNLFDTAPGYGADGYSETVLGRAIGDLPRDRVLIETKCGIWWQDDEGSYLNTRDGRNIYINLSRRAVIRSLEDSLRRLGTDYVDVLTIHYPARPPFDTPPEETMEALGRLRAQGKIRAVGVSNVDAGQLAGYLQWGDVDLVQQKFSMLDRAAYHELAGLCAARGIAFQAYSPIEQGLLTDGLSAGYIPPAGNARAGKPWWNMERRQDILAFLSKLKVLAQAYGCSVANLVVAWTIQYAHSMNALCGARRVPQIEELVRGAAVPLSQQAFRLMTEAADDLIGRYAG